MNFYSILLLLFSSILISADIEISSPSSDSTFTSKITLKIKDNDKSPSMDDLQTLNIILCTGANDNIQQLTTLKTVTGTPDSSYDLTIPTTIGDDGSYFLELYGVYTTGYTIHYSHRFTLSGMTGGSGVASGSEDSSAPSAVSSVATDTTTTDDATTATSITLPADYTNSFSIPYNLQSGSIKYAPMQQQPTNTVTKTTWSKQYPTSSVSYFTAPLVSLEVITTVTPGWSYTRLSAANYASAALNPIDDGSWYHPSKNIIKPTLRVQ